MSDGQALPKAVHDDLPRLAYADRCDEQGDAARADFIRMQIERCRIPSWLAGNDITPYSLREFLGAPLAADIHSQLELHHHPQTPV